MTSTHRLCLSQLVLILLVLTAVNGCTTSQFLSSGTCYDCDVTCYQCNAGTASDCTACVSTRSLLSDNTCHCIDGYA